MRSILWMGLLAFACSEAKEKPSEAVDAAGEAAQMDKGKSDLKELEAAFAEIVQTKRAGDSAKRRDQCIELEPKVAERLAANASDVKLQQFAQQLDSFCPEAIESRKLMKKAAEPEPPMPELSPTMKRMFTASSLKADFKKAVQTAKKKGDPEEACKKIGITARVVGESKRKDKKTKKLLKSATAFCEGPAAIATVQFHLREAAKAEKADESGPLSEHCAAALARLMDVKPGKQRDRLDQEIKGLCREAYALKAMLDSRGS